MIIFIKAVIVLGMVAFPIIKGLLSGVVSFHWTKGFVIGVHYNRTFFGAIIGDEEKAFQLNTLSFHLTFFTICMIWSQEREDLEIQK
tara:strand:- start:15429 stop:15689 length:261 start_codon:yes stop_codon:yes gene_type:complete